MSDEGVVDPESGLYTEAFFYATLQLRVAAGQRLLRPMAVVLLEIEGATPARVAVVLREILRTADVACRLDDGTIALLLEDTADDGAVWAAERIRRGIAVLSADAVLRAGIAAYPSQAFDAAILLRAATDALESARQWPVGRIEIA